MAYPTAGGSSAALKGCATRKEIILDVFGQPPDRDEFSSYFGKEQRGTPGCPVHLHFTLPAAAPITPVPAGTSGTSSGRS
jgi:hypothetical protein